MCMIHKLGPEAKYISVVQYARNLKAAPAMFERAVLIPVIAHASGRARSDRSESDVP